MDRGDAEDATERAVKTYNLCERLVAELEALTGRGDELKGSSQARIPISGN